MKEKVFKWGNIIVNYFRGIENLYLKFILTIIALALVDIAINLSCDRHVDVGGSVIIDGSVDTDVSGEIDTYEQNNSCI